MNQEKLWLEFSTLPPKAQKLVLEFIGFMQKSYRQMSLLGETDKPQVRLADDLFVGMWQDHEALADSSVWVREVRNQEWGQGASAK